MLNAKLRVRIANDLCYECRGKIREGETLVTYHAGWAAVDPVRSHIECYNKLGRLDTWCIVGKKGRNQKKPHNLSE